MNRIDFVKHVQFAIHGWESAKDQSEILAYGQLMAELLEESLVEINYLRTQFEKHGLTIQERTRETGAE